MRQRARRILAIMRKERLHILRDPQTLFIVVLMPVIMMFIYGYALTTDVRDAAIAIEDLSGSTESKAVIRSIDASTLFKVTAVENAIADTKEYFRRTRVKAIVRFPSDFAGSLRRKGDCASILVLVDGSEPNLANIIRNSAETAIMTPLLSELNIEKPEPIRLHTRVLYNPAQRSAFYFVPGLMVLILTMMSALLTSVALVREKESGTLAQLIVSPLSSAEIIFGKIIPYIVLAAVDGSLVLIIGRIAFGVMINGSAILLGAVSFLFIIVSLSIGLIISSVTSSRLHAMFAAIMITLMPTVIMTGFIFPVSSMPVLLRGISAVIPATYFLQIVRGIILKGVGLEMLWKPTVVLGLQAIVLMSASIRMFRMKI